METSYHLGIAARHLRGNGPMGRYVFLPGDRSRAERIAARFEVTERVESPRGHDSHLGILRSADGAQAVEVLSVSSGMGPASVEIVVHELLALGARRVVRVGSSGSMSPEVPPGSVVVATGAVRDESTSDRWTPPSFPALSHPAAVAAMCQGARDAGLAERTFAGVVHTKDSLYAREFQAGPMGVEHQRFHAILQACGVLASEMEASTLFTLAAAASAGRPQPIAAGTAGVPVQAACVLAVYGGEGTDVTRRADARAIDVACAGVLAWARGDAR